MALLADYAVTPDVFDITSYTSEEVCGLCLEMIREAILTEGLVRDLWSGEWRKSFEDPARAWHRRSKELIKKLASQSRLIPFPAGLRNPPVCDQDWCAEALKSHEVQAIAGGIIVTETVKDAFAREPLVARIDRLGAAPWWRAARSPSVRLSRRLADYTKHLEPVLRCSNSLLFIDPHLDPHLDPMQERYDDIGELIAVAGQRYPSPRIEIHRVCYEGSGPGRRFPMRDEGDYFERRFRDGLSGRLRAAGLQAEVFVWDGFHDRYLISNLVGISLPNGFDTDRNPNSVTRWTRLGRTDSDDVLREFEPNNGRHTLRASFTIP